MNSPENVKTSQTYKMKELLFNQNGFAISIGNLIGSSTLVLGMRWNGKNDKPGFPYAGKHSLWFTIPSNLSFSILTGILSNKSIPKETYQKVLSYLPVFEDEYKGEKEIEANEELLNDLF